MRILRIKLKNYRGVVEREVRLAPGGVTVLQGPNEIGKSSLAEAVDVVFKHLDSAASKEIKAIKPVHADEGAEVEVDVECGSYAFTLFKRFHKRPATRLDVSRPRPESLTGREAHDRARAILGESIDLELWDALRIQQGTGVEQADLKDQRALAIALDRAAGSSEAGDREESLFELARKEFERYYTETGKPKQKTGADEDSLPRLEQAVNAARQELMAIDSSLAALEADISRCVRLDNEITRFRGEQVVLEAQGREREAAWKAVQGRKAELASLDARKREALLLERNAVAEVEARQKLITDLAETRQAHAALAAEMALRAPQRQLTLAELTRAAAELQAARQVDEAALRLLKLRREDQAFRDRELNLEMLRERKSRIDAAIESARSSEQLLLRTTMTDALLADIEKAHVAVEVARSKLEAARTAVELEALVEIEAVIGDTSQRLVRGERRALSVEGTLHLEIPGVARLTVKSGASSAAVAEEHDKTRKRLLAHCEKGGVSGIAEARSVNEARREAERVKAHKDRSLKDNLRDLTPEVLERKIAELELHRDYLSQRVPEPAVAADLDAAKVLCEAAELAARDSAERKDRAERAHEEVRKRHDGQKDLEVSSVARLELAREHIGAAQHVLDGARMKVSDEDLAKERDAMGLKARSCEAAHLEASQRLAAEQPDKLEEMARHAAAALARAVKELRQLEDERLEVMTRLRARDEEGLEERRGAARARLERLELEHEGLLARANAARLLFETLRELRDATRKRYVAPLRERIEKLGSIVFGESLQVDLGDDLQIQSRTLGGRTVPFKDLSVGTQEQLAVIARLACAMTVSADGGVPVILDDALGYSDPERLQEMGAVIARAGRDTQIIILTCMPERYRYIGSASVLRLD